jgi:hypothetical protein
MAQRVTVASVARFLKFLAGLPEGDQIMRRAFEKTKQEAKTRAKKWFRR